MLYGKNIEPRCEYCERGRDVDEDHVVCSPAGVVSKGYKCGKFIYTPLKRTPRPQPVRAGMRLADTPYSEE